MGKVIYPRKGEVHTVPVALPPVGTSLNDMSWEDIRKVSDAGLASGYFSVGERKEIMLNGIVGDCTFDNHKAYAYIIGFDHNAELEGTNRIHFQFGYSTLQYGSLIAFVDSGFNSSKTSGSWFNMYNTASNYGGWNGSLMKTVICPAFKSAMPSDLQAVLKTVTKYSDNTGGGSDTASYVTATSEEIFLLSEYEVFGTKTYANSEEQNYQAQYDWYLAGNSKARLRHNNTNGAAHWWLRSTSVTNSYSYCSVHTSGSANVYSPNIPIGFTPAFCV